MSLPGWVKRDRAIAESGQFPRVLKLIEALSIAWEALKEAQAPLGTGDCRCEGCEAEGDASLEILKDAMRRIEEMGK